VIGLILGKASAEGSFHQALMISDHDYLPCFILRPLSAGDLRDLSRAGGLWARREEARLGHGGAEVT